jgi:hypothetical protein
MSEERLTAHQIRRFEFRQTSPTTAVLLIETEAGSSGFLVTREILAGLSTEAGRAAEALNPVQ